MKQVDTTEVSRDYRRWMIVDTKTSMALVTLTYKINKNAWSNVPTHMIPKDRQQEWSLDYSKGAIFPTVCAEGLKRTFLRVGREVKLILV